jgi:enolase
LAASKAGAASRGIPLWKHYAEIAGNPVPYTLPVPCFNVINGGEHAGNKLPFQEFFVIPTGAENFTESMISKFIIIILNINQKPSSGGVDCVGSVYDSCLVFTHAYTYSLSRSWM